MSSQFGSGQSLDVKADGRCAQQERLRLAIVGTGKIAHRFLKQGAVSSKASFVATCARHTESARARAEEYGIPRWYDDYCEMYDAVKPEGVVIATPNATHVRPALEAMSRGIHVLCEKPMASTWEDCETMVRVARDRGVVFLALPYDATPSMLAALHWMNESTLGIWTGAEAQLLLPGPSRDGWYYGGLTRGGAGLDTIAYPVSRLLTLLGPASFVTARANNLIPHRRVGNGSSIDYSPPSLTSEIVPSSVDDNVSLLLEWQSGQQACVRAMWGTSYIRNDTVIYGRRATLWISGDRVIIHSPDKVLDAKEVPWNGLSRCFEIPVRPITDLVEEGLIDHFADCIRGVANPTCGGAQQLHLYEILFKAYEASHSGKTMKLETSFVPWFFTEVGFSDTRAKAL